MTLLSTGTEFKRFRSGRLPKLALLVLLFIPLIYGALYLWAFWNPTEHMNKLPVALVDEDQPALASTGPVKAGHALEQSLLARKDLDWHTVSANQAAAGVKRGTYYFVVTIPQNFSARIASAADSDAKAAEINVTFNDTNSFLATTLGKEVMSQIQTTVSDATADQLTHTLLTGTQKLATGVRQAANAGGRLHGGAATLSASTGTLSAGLGTLAAGADTLSTGSSKVTRGASELAGSLAPAKSQSATLAAGANSLESGSSKVADGAASASTGASQLTTGAGSLSSGIDKLATGLDSTSAGAGTLDSGLGELKTSSSELAAGLATLQQQTTSLPSETAQLSTGAAGVAKILTTLEQLEASDPSMTLAQANAALAAAGGFSGAAGAAEEVATGAQTLASSAPTLTAGIADAASGATKLSAGVAAAATGATNLNAGVKQLSDGAASAQSGAKSLQHASGELSTGLTSLASGAAGVRSGSARVAAGTSTLAGGVAAAGSAAAQIASGSGEVSSGAAKLASNTGTAASGAAKLDTGARELTAKLGEFATTAAAGARQAPNFTQAQIDTVAKVVSAPISLQTKTLNAESSWGAGFAPFFISLATFVGALITWLILRPLPSRPLGSNTTGLRNVLTGFLPAAVISAGQVVVMFVVMHFALGLDPAHWLGMIAFMWLMALAFLALQQLFIVAFGSAPGRLLSLVLLMLMLTSSGGTYPVETTPGFFRALHPFMPASYAVNGLRSLIAGGVQPRFWLALGVFIAILAVSLAVSAKLAERQKVWTIARLHPELEV